MKRLSVRKNKNVPGVQVFTTMSLIWEFPIAICGTALLPPALMYEELRKAYDTTADRIWLANCGDLKGAEIASLFIP